MTDAVSESIVGTVSKGQLALDHILEERRRQDAKWGEQNHDGAKWVLIATEELGELSESLLKEDRPNYIVELTQLAAVTLAWLECEYRRGVTIPSIAQKEEVKSSASQFQVVSMERDETKNSSSPMWRCLTDTGEKVNVFKHTDPKKDTFRLFDGAGYGPMMQLMKRGDVLTWKEFPISVSMEKKGDWWEVVRVEPMMVGAKPEIGRDDAKAKMEAAAWAKALIDAGDFVIIDTETSGLDKERDQPVSVAIVDSKGNMLLDTLVKPTVVIDKGASDVHGIDDEKLKDAPKFYDVHHLIQQFTRDKKVIAYNAEFDGAMLRNTNVANERPVFSSDMLECAMLQYAKFYGEWNPHRAEYKNQTLSNALEQQGIEFVGTAHSAIGDCQATLKLIEKMAAYDPHPF